MTIKVGQFKPSSQKRQKGAALMMALTFFTLASFVIMQLSDESISDALLARQDIRRIKSYYSAKAGLELALLRIKAFEEAKEKIASLNPAIAKQAGDKLSVIWSFPLPWPIPIPDDFSQLIKDENKKLMAESLVRSLNFDHEITDTSQKIDINSLGSPSKSISEKSMEALMRSFRQLLEGKDEFAQEHSEESVQEALNNIADWIDEDEESRNGGSEQGLYPYEEQESYPRNQSLIDLSELLLIKKVDSLIYAKLKQLCTAHGVFGINVNTANKSALMGLSEQFTEDFTDRFIARRTEIQKETGDLNENSFDNLLQELGFSNIPDLHSKGIPILYSPLATFTIKSTGYSGDVSTEITAKVINTEAIKEIFIEQLDKDASAQGGGTESGSSGGDGTAGSSGSSNPAGSSDSNPPGTTPANSTKKYTAPKGRPYIIFMDVS